MEYEEALKIGQGRAEAAAAYLGERTGLASQTVCAVKDLSSRPGELLESERWAPVGEDSFADIAVCRGRRRAQESLAADGSLGPLRSASHTFLEHPGRRFTVGNRPSRRPACEC